MAARLPLVLVGGQIRELPAGDTVDSGVSAGDVVGGTRYAELQVQENVLLSTSLVPATGLAFTVSAGGTYLLDGLVRYNGPTTSDVKIGFSGPVMSQVLWFAGGVDASGSAVATTGPMQVVGMTGIGASNTVPVGCSGGLVTVAAPRGVFRPAAAGVLQLVWSQNSANALASSLYPPSFLTLTRVA